MHDHQPGIVTLFQRVLSNKIIWNIKVKIGRKHIR
jgi:hypothetical protein